MRNIFIFLFTFSFMVVAPNNIVALLRKREQRGIVFKKDNRENRVIRGDCYKNRYKSAFKKIFIAENLGTSIEHLALSMKKNQTLEVAYLDCLDDIPESLFFKIKLVEALMPDKNTIENKRVLKRIIESPGFTIKSITELPSHVVDPSVLEKILSLLTPNA